MLSNRKNIQIYIALHINNLWFLPFFRGRFLIVWFKSVPEGQVWGEPAEEPTLVAVATKLQGWPWAHFEHKHDDSRPDMLM